MWKFAELRTEVVGKRYEIIEEFADALRAPTRDSQAFDQFASFERRTPVRLDVLVLETFPVEEALKKEWTRVLWNQIFNTTIKLID